MPVIELRRVVPTETLIKSSCGIALPLDLPLDLKLALLLAPKLLGNCSEFSWICKLNPV